MTETTTYQDTRRELDYRDGDGIEVSLLWDAATDALSVRVYDASADETFELVVESAYALDAFEHPFAYAAYRGVPYTAGTRQPVYA